MRKERGWRGRKKVKSRGTLYKRVFVQWGANKHGAAFKGFVASVTRSRSRLLNPRPLSVLDKLRRDLQNKGCYSCSPCEGRERLRAASGLPERRKWLERNRGRNRKRDLKTTLCNKIFRNASSAGVMVRCPVCIFTNLELMIQPCCSV